MRFTIENHKPGTIRYVKRFAFWPRLIGTSRVWLECYYVKQGWFETSKDNFFSDKTVYFSKWYFQKYLLPEDAEIQKHLADKSPLGQALK